jgi:EmrB/QacA subfamily drug resistance transporter
VDSNNNPSSNRWKSLAVCLVAGALTMLDVSIINVALPTIELRLGGTATELQVIVAGYTLAFGLALIPAGRLGDLHGRSKMFVIGVVTFALTSLLAGFAPSATFLAVARVFQGLAAGIINPQVTGIIQELFKGKERAKAFGAFGTMVGVSTAVGPLLGGTLLQFLPEGYDWRSVFWVNVPVAIVAVVAAFKVLPFDKNRKKKTKFDLRGIGLIAIVSLGIMMPFLSEGNGSVFSIVSLEWFAIAVVAFFGLYFWEKHYYHKHQVAVLDPRLIKNKSFLFGTLVGTTYFSGFSATLLLITMLLQNGLGASPLQAGLVATPFAIASAFGSQFAAKMVLKIGRFIVVGGVTLALLGSIASSIVIFFAPHELIPFLLAVTMGITGFGAGNVIAPNNTLSLSSVPSEIGSTAGGVISLGQRIGQSIGVAVTLSIFYGMLQSGVSIETSVVIAFIWTFVSLAVSAVIGFVDAKRSKH